MHRDESIVHPQLNCWRESRKPHRLRNVVSCSSVPVKLFLYNQYSTT